MDLKNVSKETWLRTIVLIVALINQGLQMSGKQILPYAPEEIADGISFIITICASFIAWWKNNSFTTEAQKADKTFKK